MMDCRLRGNDGGELGNDGQDLCIGMLMRKPCCEGPTLAYFIDLAIIPRGMSLLFRLGARKKCFPVITKREKRPEHPIQKHPSRIGIGIYYRHLSYSFITLKKIITLALNTLRKKCMDYFMKEFLKIV